MQRVRENRGWEPRVEPRVEPREEPRDPPRVEPRGGEARAGRHAGG